MKDHNNPNQISLTFIVNGEAITLDNVNIHQPLKAAVERAINNSENSGRPLSDWIVKWNEQSLDVSKKIEELGLPDGATIFVSLKSGKGGWK